jgi:hypothetical protein
VLRPHPNVYATDATTCTHIRSWFHNVYLISTRANRVLYEQNAFNQLMNRFREKNSISWAWIFIIPVPLYVCKIRVLPLFYSAIFAGKFGGKISKCKKFCYISYVANSPIRTVFNMDGTKPTRWVNFKV